MKSKLAQSSLPALTAAAAALFALVANAGAAASGYIVEAHGTDSAAKAVQRVGGRITHELPIVGGVSAMLTPAQAARLRKDKTLELFADMPVRTQQAAR
jgi:hypothetical protein